MFDEILCFCKFWVLEKLGFFFGWWGGGFMWWAVAEVMAVVGVVVGSWWWVVQLFGMARKPRSTE